jgi:hypothetical protein
LEDAQPEWAAQLDRTFVSWGERWVVPQLTMFDLDDWLTPAEAAELGGVDTATVRMWRARGRLDGHLNSNGDWRYRAGDVIALISAPRARPGRSTAGELDP